MSTAFLENELRAKNFSAGLRTDTTTDTSHSGLSVSR
jgi:hypothetical protein